MSVDRLVAGKPPRARDCWASCNRAAIMHRRLYLAQPSTFHAYASAYASSALFQEASPAQPDGRPDCRGDKSGTRTHASCRAAPTCCPDMPKCQSALGCQNLKVPKVPDYAIHSSAWSASIVNQGSKGKALRAFSVYCCSRNSFRQSFRSNFSLTRLADAHPV